MSELALGKYAYINLTNKISLGSIDSETLHKQILGNGSVMGFIAEYLIASEFDNVETQTGQKEWDIIVNGNLKVECKSGNSSKSSFDIATSYMKGVGRKFDPQEFLMWLNRIDGVVIIDIAQAPIIWLYPISTEVLIPNMRIGTGKTKGSITSKINLKTAILLTGYSGT
jgi:hypothetical protein